MNHFKQKLQKPIPKTLLLTGIFFVISILLGMLSIYTNRLLYAYDEAGRGPVLFNMTHTLVGDFLLLSRIAFELLIVFLIAQLIHRTVRFVRKKS